MIRLQTAEQMQHYLTKMLDRTDHAKGVRQSAIKVFTCALRFKDLGTDLIVKEYGASGEAPDGRNPGNVMWSSVGGQRYAYTYSHNSVHIEVKLGGLQGPVVQTFKDTDDSSAIYDWFLSKMSTL